MTLTRINTIDPSLALIEQPPIQLPPSLDELEKRSFDLQKLEVTTFPFANQMRWTKFVANLFQQYSKIPDPFSPVEKVATHYLKNIPSTNPVLDIGTETGKNACCLIKQGHQVILLDIAPNAIQFTLQLFKEQNLETGVQDAIIGSIEKLDPIYGPFKAVVGTYAFPFIPPELFNDVMESNVLGRIEPKGYFAGAFFGPDHSWAHDRSLTILSTDQLRKFFQSRGFAICEMKEIKKEEQTVLNGKQLFHTIEVIAQKV